MQQVFKTEGLISVARRIDAISYDSGSEQADFAEEAIVGKGTVSITNKIDGAVETEPGVVTKRLTVTVSVAPDGDSSFYSMRITASGLYRNASYVAAEDMDEVLLTAGFQDLYAYIKSVASTILRGGPYGEPAMPIVSAVIEEDDD